MPRTSRSTLQREKHTRRLAPMSMKLLDYRTTHGGLTRARTSQKPRCGHGPARPSSPSCPGSPCLAHLQPEIGGAPLNLDGSAHLVQTGPHSFPDAIPQRVLGQDGGFSAWRPDFLCLHVIKIVGRNDGATRMGQVSRALHVSFVQNVTQDRKSTRLNSSHVEISYAVFCLKK